MKESKPYLALSRTIVAVSVVGLLVAGCSKNLGIPDAQLMEKNLPQNFTSTLPVEKAWQSICAKVADNPDCQVLVKDPKAHLISWVEPAENWRDLGQDAIVHCDPFVNPNRFKKMARSSARGIAITSVLFEKAISGCKIHIRRVYYGPDTFSGVAHSRGDYEHNFVANLK